RGGGGAGGACSACPAAAAPRGRGARWGTRRPPPRRGGPAAPRRRTPTPSAPRRSPACPRRTRRGRRTGRDAGGAGRRASGLPRREAARPRHPDERRQPARLRARRRLSERRDPVIAPPLVVHLGGGPLARLLDQALLEHPLDRAVQRPRPEPDLSAGPLRDLLEDRVAVPVFPGERYEDVERRLGQRQDGFEAGLVMHGPIISTVDISTRRRLRKLSRET